MAFGFSTSKNRLNTKMDLKWREFEAQLMRVQQRTRRRAKDIVQSNSRKLIKKFAFLAPYDTGRLRAGFWPAAFALQMSNIYTPYPNKGEGIGQARLEGKNPSMRIVNSVPYVANAGGRGSAWWFQAIIGITERMKREMSQGIKTDWRP